MADDRSDLLADIDLEAAFPDADFVQQDFENFNPQATVLGPPFVLASIVGYAIQRDDALDTLQRLVEEDAAQAENGKYNKTDALYSPIAPPPGAWDYRCEQCRFYKEGEGENGAGKCSIVGHEEDPWGGENIYPGAWCAYWLPYEGTEWFTWVTNIAEGTNQ